jgi:biopolymer transport protein TolR
VSIRADGRIFVGDDPINILLLEDRVRGMLTQTSAKLVYLRADEALRYGQVIEVVDKLKSAGVDQIGFVYQLPEESGSR